LIVLDSVFSAKRAILVPAQNLGWKVNLVLRNVQVTGTDLIVSTRKDKPILTGNRVEAWAAGFRYSAKHPDGTIEEGPLNLEMPAGLLTGSKVFARDKPQYGDRPASDFIDVVRAFGVKNDGNEKDAEENRLRIRLALVAANAQSTSSAPRGTR
jgi:hypothetical protein